MSIGTGPTGQGHQTTWAQIISSQTGIGMEDINILVGDSKASPEAIGSFGSRSVAVDGSAAFEASTKIVEKAAKIAAHLLEASSEDIKFADGAAHVAGSPDQSVTWAEIAKTAYAELSDAMENLGNLGGAIRAAKEMLTLDSADANGRATMERLFHRAERWEDLAAFLLDTAAKTDDPAQQAEALGRLCKVQIENLVTLDESVATLEQIDDIHAESEAIVTLGAQYF